MEAPVISTDVLARYAGDAALEVAGVSGLTRDAAEVASSAEKADVVVHLELEWGASADAVIWSPSPSAPVLTLRRIAPILVARERGLRPSSARRPDGLA